MSSFSADKQFPQDLTVDQLRALSREKLIADASALDSNPQSRGDFDLNPDVEVLMLGEARPAAILVPIRARQPLSVLLTQRPQHLPSHAGQISFPGGKIEPRDHDARHAALREADEEIGLEPGTVDVLGFLPQYRTATGFLITPVVGLVAPDFTARPDPDEVDEVFEVPLAYLMSVANHRIESRQWKGAERRYYSIPFENRYIWGATAGILRALYEKLFIQ